MNQIEDILEVARLVRGRVSTMSRDEIPASAVEFLAENPDIAQVISSLLQLARAAAVTFESPEA